MKLFRLGQRGHTHIIALLLVVVAVGSIGTYVYTRSQAQSLACNTQTFQTTTSTSPVTCVQYIQQMLNGIYARSVGSDPSNSITGLGKNPSYATMTIGSYKSDLLLVHNQFGKVSSLYDTTTANQVTIFQRSLNTPGTATTITPSGKVDSATWQLLCTNAVNNQLSSDGHTLADRDVPVSAHTPAGYADSYRRAGVSAGIDAGCTRPAATTGGGTGSTPVATNYNECQELGGTHAPAPNGAESCTLNGNKFTVASDDVPNAWGHVTSSTIKLLKWKVSFTAPTNLVNGLYYQVDPGENIYDFTTPKALTASCIAYFGTHGQEASVELDQFVLSKAAKSIPNPPANAGSMTLDQYYTAHKAAGGNYFLDANGRKVWKIGTHFYDLLTDTRFYAGTAFTNACPGVTGDYQAQLAATIPTVKE